MKKLFTFSLISLFSISAFTQAGSPLTTFGTGGKAITPIGSGGDRSFGMVVQPDGKLITAGFSNAAVREVALIRYNGDGTLDNTFGGGDGIVTTAVGGVPSLGYAVALQKDGKIVVAGNYNSQDFLVLRYNTDGTLDNTFSDDGYVTTGIHGTSSDIAYAVVVQPDGKIVAAGRGYATNQDFALVRYNTDGSLDNTFGGDGIVITGVGPAGDDLRAVTLQADGKIVAAGYSSSVFNGTGTTTDYALARFNTDGSLDNTFSDDGLQTVHIGSGSDWAYDVAVQADGKLLACGISNTAMGDDLSVVRFNADGSLDYTFDGDGKVLVNVGTDDDFRAMHLQADGKIVFGGNVIEGSATSLSVVRLLPDGSLDTSFDGDGKVTTSTPMSADRAWNMTMGGDRIYLGGHTSQNGTDDMYVLAYQNDALPLPLSLLSFSAFKQNAGVVLRWTTTAESNLSHFEVERSNDGRNFKTVGRIMATGSNPASTNEYTFSDHNAAGQMVYYRLKMVDRDEKTAYSKVVTVKGNQDQQAKIYPNPANDQIYVQTFHTGKMNFTIYNTAGSVVRTVTTTANGPMNSTPIAVSGLQTGLYRIVIQGEGEMWSGTFLKSKN